MEIDLGMTVSKRDLNEEEGEMGQTGNSFGQIICKTHDSADRPSVKQIKGRASGLEVSNNQGHEWQKWR